MTLLLLRLMAKKSLLTYIIVKKEIFILMAKLTSNILTKGERNGPAELFVTILAFNRESLVISCWFGGNLLESFGRVGMACLAYTRRWSICLTLLSFRLARRVQV